MSRIRAIFYNRGLFYKVQKENLLLRSAPPNSRPSYFYQKAGLVSSGDEEEAVVAEEAVQVAVSLHATLEELWPALTEAPLYKNQCHVKIKHRIDKSEKIELFNRISKSKIER